MTMFDGVVSELLCPRSFLFILSLLLDDGIRRPDSGFRGNLNLSLEYTTLLYFCGNQQ